MLTLFLEKPKRRKGNTDSTIANQKGKERPPPPRKKNPQEVEDGAGE